MSLAGWLFADLALLLFIITVAVAADFPFDTADASTESVESPSPTPSEEPSPSPTAEPGVESEPHVFYVDTDADGIISGDDKAEDGLTGKLRDDFEELVDQGYTVGFALTFGGAAEPGYGGDLAEAANKVLRKAFPELFGDAPTRHFWTVSGKGDIKEGTLQIELYLLAV
ncbi:hypothetical protein [Glycomyces buryatensis]|uniref:Uncharacterized protein n=1 Tax=Glycomyces buryatensis TaxID=2570927 RepID=A0A4S8QHR2_9ACTN|nr:hypothetical protein [Glycomyces buryatensis]THV43281.1 hypothetical protein FAB82_02105 [Glycomyces buryatensis]